MSISPEPTPPESDPERTQTQTPVHDADAVTNSITAASPQLTPIEPLRFDDADEPIAIPGYLVQRELARGGMGVVYIAIDPAFNREVAIKVLLPELRHEPEALARFAAEVRISGRLQHPGIPPVHDLGTLADGRPFLAMKLIRGETLASIIKARREASLGAGSTDSLDLIQVFEQVCQAVGYAHSAGVVHRDLKPHNVMVGAFGEVQVMDWGLGKELRCSEPGPSNTSNPTDLPPPLPMASSRSSESTVTVTQPGAILGTPAYMPPEQARGHLDRVDARSDVFALGGILCAILTGRPPYLARSGPDGVRQASAGDLSEAFARLDACGADAELIALAKSCLSRHALNRPADGGAVARLIADYRAGVERRLREAEAERAATAAREAERRKKRRVQIALAAALGVLLVGGLLAAWREDRLATERRLEQERVENERRSERDKAEVARAFQERQTREGVGASLALAADLRRLSRFREARDILRQAQQRLAGGIAEDLQPVVALALEDVQLAQQLDRIRYQKAVWVPAKLIAGRILDPAKAVAAYPAALQSRGFNPLSDDPDAVAARIQAAAIRVELVEALDDWVAFEPDEAVQARVLAVLRRVDPGPWLDRFRDPGVRTNPEAVESLAADADAAALSPAVLVAFGTLMQRHGFDPSKLLARAQVVRPGDFDLAIALGLWASSRADYPKALGHFRVARALRPENGAALAMTGILLAMTFDLDAAVPTLEEAVRVDPDFPVAWTTLGCVRTMHGDIPGAMSALETAIRLDPNLPHAHMALGIVLFQQKEHARAVEHYREVIRLDPIFPMVYQNLGLALWALGDLDAALLAFRTAHERDPNNVNLKRELAALLNDIGNARRTCGELDSAVNAYQEAIDLNPTDPTAHFNLGSVWQYERQNPRRAIPAYEAALRLNPQLAIAHANLAMARLDIGDRARGLEAAEQAVKLAPKNALYRNNLGWAKFLNGDSDGAIPEYEEAIRLDPQLAFPHNNIGLIWMANGDTERAASAFQRAAELNPKWDAPRANLGDLALRTGNADRAVTETREAIRLNPSAARHRTMLARALAARGEYRDAMDELAQALAANPAWENDPSNACRFYRAAFAVRAGLGHGKNPVPAEERAALRQRALQWLKADCAARQRAYPPENYRYQMRMLLQEPNLAFVRHPFFLTMLPAAEAQEWIAFWDEIRQARDDIPDQP